MKNNKQILDHRKIAQQLELFFFHETAPSMPYWLPKGVILKNQLINFWRDYHEKHNYQEIQSPLLNKKELWEISGHWDFYQDDMFKFQDGNSEWALKPMNCPNAMLIWKNKPRSYRELPLRLSDMDLLHRNERSGASSGIFRTKCFSQDDAHNFVSEELLEAELLHIMQVISDFYGIFNIKERVKLYLSTRPDDFIGEIKQWDRSEEMLRKILEKSNFNFSIKEKDGAFYGPKIDIHVLDSQDREWQCGTVQLDFNLPKRFELNYLDKDGQRKMPIVIHRAIYGSLERFLGIILEHYQGKLPFWCSPIQIKILSVSNSKEISEYINEVKHSLSEAFLNYPFKFNRIRFEIDCGEDSISDKIKLCMEECVPSYIVVGEREVKDRSLSLYLNGKKQQIKFNENIWSAELLLGCSTLTQFEQVITGL